MSYRSLYTSSLFDELNRLQRQLAPAFDWSTPSIRGHAGGYPAVNVGHTPSSVEIYAFVPGMEPSKIDLTLERGVLTISGERPAGVGGSDAALTVHSNERFAGRFRRVISLPDDCDTQAVQAACRDGVLQISVKRRESALPRRIEVQ